jgi:hypothetical protein
LTRTSLAYVEIQEMARSIPAFSKKSSSGPTVSGGGQRKGFLDNVKQTTAAKRKPVANMAAFHSASPRTGAKGNMGHPAFKGHSGSAGKSVPAFSKKKI